MRILDRTLSILLILGGIAHTMGCLKVYTDRSLILWSMCSSLFVFTLAAINLLRASRPHDDGLGWICLAAGFGWLLACAFFGKVVVNNIFDPRAVIFTVITAGLCAFSVRTILQSPD